MENRTDRELLELIAARVGGLTNQVSNLILLMLCLN